MNNKIKKEAIRELKRRVAKNPKGYTQEQKDAINKSYLEILGEKIKPKYTQNISGLEGTKARVGEMIMNAAQIPQDALTALHTRDKYGVPLEKTYKERFAAGHTPSEVLPQTPQFSNMPTQEFQGLLQNVVYDPLIVPMARIFKGSKIGQRLMSGYGDLSSLELKAINKSLDDTEIIKIGEKLKGNNKAIQQLLSKENELKDLIKQTNDLDKKSQLAVTMNKYRQAREAATGIGGGSEYEQLNKLLTPEQEFISPLKERLMNVERSNRVNLDRAKKTLRDMLGNY